MNIKALASGSRGNCYHVTSDGGSPILLECGVQAKRIREGIGFRLSDVAGMMLSHEHKDHSRAVEDMLRAGVDCYMSAGTAEVLGVAEHHRVHVVRAKEQFKAGFWTILPFEIQHDAEEPLGFLCVCDGEKLLYATDTYYIRYRFDGLTHIMIECNYSKDILADNLQAGVVGPTRRNRILTSHFSLEHVIQCLQANDLSEVQEIHLLHLSDDNSDAEMFEQKVREVTGKPVFVASSDS
jgi:phosphoribosyl 1,2-cyclic phosphodiesterase